MRFVAAFVVALLAAAFTGAAGAASAPPVWTGFYVGGGAGLRASRTDLNTIDFLIPGLPGIPGILPQSFNDTSFRGGPYVGANWQFAPRWVAGVEADAGFGSRTTSQVGLLPVFAGVFFPILPGDRTDLKLSWDASLRGRLGYLVTPSTLIYGTAGPAWQRFALTSVCDIGCGIVTTTQGTRRGWAIGAGVETEIGGHWLARAEYRYANFGTARETLDYGVPLSTTATVDFKLSTSTALFGLAYRFGADGAAASMEWPASTTAAVNWTGARIGVTAGARSSQMHWTTIDISGLLPIFPGTETESFSNTGFRGGVYAGYDWQFAPRFVAGFEGDWGTGSKTTTQNGFLPGISGVFGPINPGDQTSMRALWDSSLRARLGFLLTPDVLIYLTGGQTWQRFSASATCGPGTCFMPTTSTVSKTRTGATVGGGVETALAGGWRVRAEYRYTNFGTSLETFAEPLIFLPAHVGLRFATHIVAFGLGYSFN